MNINKYIFKNCKSLKNKTIAITGATGGIGTEFCKMVITLDANLIIIGRSKNKLNKLKDELLQINNSINIDILTCDFLNIDDVKLLSIKLQSIKIDYFIHNAGAYALPKENTSLNYNNVFQINSIIPFFISKQIINNIKINNGKIIVVSSLTATKNKINKNNIQLTNKRPITIYGNSKKLELISQTQLFKEYKINYSIVHPGVSYTNITSNYKTFIHKLIKYPMKILFINNKKAALNILLGLYINTNNSYWIGPKYFNIWGLPKLKKYKIKDDQLFVYNLYNDIYNKIA